MAESVSMAARATSLCCGILLLACGSKAMAAQSLPDPTRPPATLIVGATAVASAASGPTLQSVLISPGRKVAVISGQTVQVGGMVGDARVVRIAEGEVVLVRGGQSQTLKLFPGVEKRQAKSGASVREAGRRQ